MLSRVDGNSLLAAMDMMQMREVKFMMPRFKAETSMILNKAMQNMGIRSAFTSAADFSGIAQMGPLVLDQVKQKCYIDVTETGTEAAAVTLAQIRLTAMRPVLNVPEMRVDRPFVFVIADGDNMNILFAGKIVNL
jgi:serpin B